VCLYGKEQERFQLTYTYNHKPVLALNGEIVFSPIPVLSQTITRFSRFIYHPEADKEMFLEFTGHRFIDAYVSCMSQNKGARPVLSFPDETTSQKKMTDLTSSVINFTEEEMGKLHNPICLVSVKAK
jgi:hypothetical protein